MFELYVAKIRLGVPSELPKGYKKLVLRLLDTQLQEETKKAIAAAIPEEVCQGPKIML